MRISMIELIVRGPLGTSQHGTVRCRFCCAGRLLGAAEAQGQRHSPEDPDTLHQIRNLRHGCCIVMLRYLFSTLRLLTKYGLWLM